VRGGGGGGRGGGGGGGGGGGVLTFRAPYIIIYYNAGARARARAVLR